VGLALVDGLGTTVVTSCGLALGVRVASRTTATSTAAPVRPAIAISVDFLRCHGCEVGLNIHGLTVRPPNLSSVTGAGSASSPQVGSRGSSHRLFG
jgi:hypothetical protein